MGLFGKKSEADGDDSNRSALFGSRSKDKSPAPTSSNPYAQPTTQPDPYAQSRPNPYASPPPSTASTGSLGSRQGGGYGGFSGDSKSNAYGDKKSNAYGDNKSNAYGDSKGGASDRGYGANKYGAQGGYGADKYGTTGTASNQAPASRYGAGGYGGLGKDRYGSQQDDENRAALFGEAQDRFQQREQDPRGNGAPPAYNSGGYGEASQGYGGTNQGYGSVSQDRQLTAEEEEEEEVNASKQQIRFAKQETVASTRNALRLAQQAEESGRDTLARLGTQGEHIHNTERNLDLAHNQNKLAEEKAKELKTLNKSMFAVHVANPFTAGSRRTARDQAIMDRHIDERETREATRRAAFDSDQRMQRAFKDLSVTQTGGGKSKNLAERAKYQFEADSEDDEMENEIDANLDALSGAAGRLNALARATGKEVDEQNQVLDRIGQKVCLMNYCSAVA